MTDYELVAGIETHCQLKTQTKLFCGCSTRFGAPPNSQTCPVCLGHPGSLPVLNREAFTLALKAALALNATIAPRTKFDRKNYFYPDLPKGYQISQYDMPFSSEGWIDLGNGRRVRIQRVHLEEDAGKLTHEPGGERSLVDLNRAGMPLIEIVTHPDIRSADETSEYLTRLKSILIYAGASECDMEKGELRCDVNLSIRPKGQAEFGVKTEIKNLNSFRFAKEALLYEFERQKQALAKGERIVQETRLYDSEKGVTRPMRSKEEAHDYRYFPEPDLPPITVSPEEIEKIRKSIPELPEVRRTRLVTQYGLSEYDAGVLTSERALADFFEACVALKSDPKRTANWIANALLKTLNDRGLPLTSLKITPRQFVDLLHLEERSEISGATAKEVLAEMAASGAAAAEIIDRKGLRQVSDASALEEIARTVIAENAKIVADYKGGKEAALKALIGRIMKATQGRANPKTAEDVLKKLL